MNFDIFGELMTYIFLFNLAFLPYLNKKKHLGHQFNNKIVYIKRICHHYYEYQIHSCRLSLSNLL